LRAVAKLQLDIVQFNDTPYDLQSQATVPAFFDFGIQPYFWRPHRQRQPRTLVRDAYINMPQTASAVTPTLPPPCLMPLSIRLYSRRRKANGL
jgi:hypothetical protein